MDIVICIFIIVALVALAITVIAKKRNVQPHEFMKPNMSRYTDVIDRKRQ